MRENATKVPFQDRWVFEGAWDTVVSRDRFKAIGGGSVPSLGGLKTDALLEIINECFACHFRRPL